MLLFKFGWRSATLLSSNNSGSFILQIGEGVEEAEHAITVERRDTCPGNAPRGSSGAVGEEGAGVNVTTVENRATSPASVLTTGEEEEAVGAGPSHATTAAARGICPASAPRRDVEAVVVVETATSTSAFYVEIVLSAGPTSFQLASHVSVLVLLTCPLLHLKKNLLIPRHIIQRKGLV